MYAQVLGNFLFFELQINTVFFSTVRFCKYLLFLSGILLHGVMEYSYTFASYRDGKTQKKKKSCSYPNIFGYILITDFFRKEKRKKESTKFFLWLVLEKRS